MSTAMTPYRQAAIVEVEEVTPKRTGLLLPLVKHKCVPPLYYTETKIEKKLFGLYTRTTRTEHKVPIGSLYRCPDCKIVHHFKSLAYSDAWDDTAYALELWLKRTGEID